MEGKKLLIVDDEKAIIEFLEEYLTKQGYEVETAKDGEVATERIRARKPDFVITDMDMPKLSGMGVIDYLVREFPDHADRPAVLVTSGRRNDSLAALTQFCETRFGRFDPREQRMYVAGKPTNLSVFDLLRDSLSTTGTFDPLDHKYDAAFGRK